MFGQRRKQYPPPGLIGGALKSSVAQMTEVGVGITTRLRQDEKEENTRIPRLFQRKGKAVGKVSAGMAAGRVHVKEVPMTLSERFQGKAKQVSHQPFIRGGPTQSHPGVQQQYGVGGGGGAGAGAGAMQRRAGYGGRSQTSNQSFKSSGDASTYAPEILLNDEPMDLFKRKSKAIGFMAAQQLFPSSARQEEVVEQVRGVQGQTRFQRKAKTIGFMASQPLFSREPVPVEGPTGFSRFRRKAKTVGFMAAQPLFNRLVEGEVYLDETLPVEPGLMNRFKRKAKAAGFMAAQQLFQRALSEDTGQAGRFKKFAKAILRTQRMCRVNPDLLPILELEVDPFVGSNEDEIAAGNHPLLRKDVLLHLFPYLNVSDLKTARHVCEYWKRFATLALQQKSIVKLSGICPMCKSEFMDYSLQYHEHIETIPFYRFCKFLNDIPPEVHYPLPYRNFKLSDLNLYFNIQVTTDATGVFLLFLKFWGDKTHHLHLENVQLCPPDSFYRILDTCCRLRSVVFDNCRIWLDPLAPEPDPDEEVGSFKMNLNLYLTSITFISNFVCEELLHWQMIFQAFPKLDELNLIDVTKVEINHCLAALLNLPDEEEIVDIKKVGGFKKLSRKVMLLPFRQREDELPSDHENKSFKQVTRLLVKMPFNMSRLQKLEAIAEKEKKGKFKSKMSRLLENRVALATKPKIVKIPKSRFQTAASGFACNPFSIPMRMIEPESEVPETPVSMGRTISPMPESIAESGKVSLMGEAVAPSVKEPEEEEGVAYMQVKTHKFKAAGIVAFKPFNLYDVVKKVAPLEPEPVAPAVASVPVQEAPPSRKSTPDPKIEAKTVEKTEEEEALAKKFYAIKMKSKFKSKKKTTEEAKETVVEGAAESPAEVQDEDPQKKEKTPPKDIDVTFAEKYFATKLKSKFKSKKSAASTEEGAADGAAGDAKEEEPPKVLVVAKKDIKMKLKDRLLAMSRGEIPSPGAEERSDADEPASFLAKKSLKDEFKARAKQALVTPFGVEVRGPREEREEREREKEKRRQEKAELKKKMRKNLRSIVNQPFTIVTPGAAEPVETFKPRTFKSEIKKLMFQPFQLVKPPPTPMERFRSKAKTLTFQPFNLNEPKAKEFVLPGSRLRKINISCRRNYEDQLKIELAALVLAHEGPLEEENTGDEEDYSEDSISLSSRSRTGSTSSESEPSSMRERDFAELEICEIVGEVLTRYEITHLTLRVNYTPEDSDNFPIVLEACHPKVVALGLTRPLQVFVPELDLHIRYNPFETIDETVLVLPNVTSLSIAHNIVDSMDQITRTFPSLITLCVHVVTTEVVARQIVPYKTYVKTDLMITMRSAKPHTKIKNLTWNILEARNPETNKRTVVYKSNALLYVPRVFPSLSKLIVSITTAEELHAIFRGCLALHDLIVLKNSFYRTKDYDIIGDQESEFVQFRVAGARTSPVNENRHDGIRQLKFLRRLSLENNNCLLSNQSVQYGFIHLRRLRALHISRGKKITQRALRELKSCRFLVHVSVTKEKLKPGDLRRRAVQNQSQDMIAGKLRRKPGPGIMITQAPAAPKEKFETSKKYEYFGGKKFAIVKTTYEVNGRRYELVRREYENEGERDSKVWQSRYKLAALRERELEEQRLQDAAGAELDIDPEKIIRRAERQYEEDLLNEESDFERFINDYDEEGDFDGYCDEDVELQYEDEEAELKALQEESSGEDGDCQEADTMYEGDKEYYMDTVEEKTSETESYCDSGTDRECHADKETDDMSDENPKPEETAKTEEGTAENSGPQPTPADPNILGEGKNEAPEGGSSEAKEGKAPDVPDSADKPEKPKPDPQKPENRETSDSSPDSKPGKKSKKDRKSGKEKHKKEKKGGKVREPEDGADGGKRSTKSKSRNTEEPDDPQDAAILKLTTLYRIGEGDGHAIEFNRSILEAPPPDLFPKRPATAVLCKPEASSGMKKSRSMPQDINKETTEAKRKSSSASASKARKSASASGPKIPESKSPDVLLKQELVKIKDRIKKHEKTKDKKKKSKKTTKDAQTSPPPEPSTLPKLENNTLKLPPLPYIKVQDTNSPKPVKISREVPKTKHFEEKKRLLEPGRAHSPSEDAQLRELRQALIHKMAKQVKKELHRKHSVKKDL